MGRKEIEMRLERQLKVHDILKILSEKHGARLMDSIFEKSTGDVKPRILFLLNGRNIKCLNGMEATVVDNDVLTVIPAVAGG